MARDVLDRLVGFDQRRLGRAAALLLAVVGAALAGWAFLRAPAPPPIEQTLPMAAPMAAALELRATPTTSAAAPTELFVHAAGAVAAPGVHQVSAGSRVADVLAAAGGPAPDADLDAVNLAALVADGDRIWFPRRGEVPPGQAVALAPGGGAGAGSDAAAVPLDLNAATAADLDELPGIGPAIAAAIVEHRDRNGPFASVDDLLDVPGIGEAKLAQLRPLVRV